MKHLYKELSGSFWAAKAKARLAQCTESQMWPFCDHPLEHSDALKP